jgi:hypothetical protein
VLILTHPVNFLCRWGNVRRHPEEPHDFRQSVDCLTLFTWVRYWELNPRTYSCILNAHSHSKIGGSIWSSHFAWVSVLLLNNWRVSVAYLTMWLLTLQLLIQMQYWHPREAQIKPPIFECEYEWAFRIHLSISVRGEYILTCLSWGKFRSSILVCDLQVVNRSSRTNECTTVWYSLGFIEFA